MFPNLRLIIGATIATLALVTIMGSGLFSYRDPSSGFANIPDVRRPLVQRAIVPDPEPQNIQMLAYARRNNELQRLLDLPTSSASSPPPSVTQIYPFDVETPIEVPAAAAEPSSASGDDASQIAPAAAAPELTVSAPPVASDPTPDLMMPPPDTSADPRSPAFQNDLAFRPVVAPATSRAPDAAAEPPSVAIALTEAPEPFSERDEDTRSVPESYIPAIEHAPLPRNDPRGADRRDTATTASKPSLQGRSSHVKASRVTRGAQAARHPARALPPIAAHSAGSSSNPFDDTIFEHGNSEIQ